MKKIHIVPVFLVWVGCGYGQLSADSLSSGYSSSSGVTESMPASEPTVSVARLRHRIPGRAAAAFSRALKFARRKEWRQGAKELETAVAADPDFSDAHANLGVHYLMLEQLHEAVAEFHRAIALDCCISMYHSNLALAYVLLHSASQAKMEAETAVSLDARNARAQYLLGFLLATDPAARNDAQKRLALAAEEVPQAHLALVDLYRAAGDESKASAELERYRRAVSAFKENR